MYVANHFSKGLGDTTEKLGEVFRTQSGMTCRPGGHGTGLMVNGLGAVPVEGLRDLLD